MNPSAPTAARAAAPAAPATVPWWRVPVAWFMVLSLGAMVVGSFALLATALNGADPVEDHPEVQRGGVAHMPAAPALQARNHAATPAP